ncbi:FaeA/PapI family transcriptional regulator [Citrobacter braakii]|uniref:FaeA/PapI family transcriptional regulator n=1 Tax=Citrobacter braakii TaxID=57706 RepID=UPI00351D012A
MEKEILRFFHENCAARASWSTREIADRLGVSSYTAHHWLTLLSHKGKLARTPPRQGAATWWRLV